jgi:aryl-alcohol dehydrogenase-like predicted oxidoreductase
MKFKHLSKNGPKVSVLGFGGMGLSATYGKPASFETSKKVIETAFSLGINFFDTADIYPNNEIVLGNILKQFPRDEYIIATKCGLVIDQKTGKKIRTDNSLEYILSACANSLKQLNTSYIDLFYLHRIANGGKDLWSSMEAMAQLLKEKKIRYVGLSEANPNIIEHANTALLKLTNGTHQLTAVQTEYSLLSRTPEIDDTLVTCAKLGIGFVAYAPLCRGLLTGKLDVDTLADHDFRRLIPRFSRQNMQRNQKLVTNIANLAKEKKCSPAQLALAWLLNKDQTIIPIPSTRQVDRLKENIDAIGIILTEGDKERLNDITPIGIAGGERYWAAEMEDYHLMTDSQAKEKIKR